VTEIRMPRLNTNDDGYILVEWLAADGDLVDADQAVAAVETSKASQDLLSDEAGVLHVIASPGHNYPPGALLASITPPGSPAAHVSAPPAHESPIRPDDSPDPIITAPAARLLQELGIDREQVATLGRRVVREADVEKLRVASQPDSGGDIVLGAVQQAVARAVMQSHAAIPAAYAVIKVNVGAALEAGRRIGRQMQIPIGVAELLIASLGRAFDAHRPLFATPANATSLHHAHTANVGITFDLGRGLFVPVIREVDRIELSEIVKCFAALRETALSGTFRERDLQGGNILVTLHSEPDLVLAIPIVFPGQLCALALTAPHRELVEDSDGTISRRTIVHVGISYDHRFVNGRDATLFLRAMKQTLENPDTLSSPDVARLCD
jgi:2-oxoglutarate dehydrogenase E2 component (dihydrolipoamide succinyltransferase)